MQLAPDARPSVAMNAEEVNRVVAEAVEKALKAMAKRDKKQPLPRLAYTIAEAAMVAAISRGSLYGAVRRGDLKITKKGSRTLVLDRDLRRWLEGLPSSNA